MTAQTAAATIDELAELIAERHRLVHSPEDAISAAALFDVEQELQAQIVAPLLATLEATDSHDDELLSMVIFVRDELERFADALADEMAEEAAPALALVSDASAVDNPHLVGLMAEVVVRETLESPDPADTYALLVAQVENGRYLCEETTHHPGLCAAGKRAALEQLGAEIELDRGSELWARALWVVQQFGRPVAPPLRLVN